MKLAMKATVATTAFDATMFAGADLAIQEAEKELGLRTNYDFKRTAITGILGGGLSVLPNGLANYGAVKVFGDIKAARKEISSPSLKKTADDLDAPTSKETDTMEAFYNELQIPVFVMILFFFFQMPFVSKNMKKYLPSLYNPDANPNFWGYIFQTLLFGILFYGLQKFTKYLSQIDNLLRSRV